VKNKQITLALILIVVIEVTACTQKYDSESDFKASPQDGGKSAEITEYVGSKWEVRIPPRIQNLPVTSIRNNAFSHSTNIISIIIPSSVTSIGMGTFVNCFQLTEIKVAAGNNSYIANNGVLYSKDKTSLHTYPTGKTDVSFTIPNSVTSIGHHAFYNSGLASVTIPNGVTSIGEYAFYNCTNLTNITIPNGVTNIREYAFYNCTNLTDITIPSGVTNIGEYAFYNCTNLTSITIPDGVTSIGVGAFEDCTSLINITIPPSVIIIGEYAFSRTGFTSKSFETLRPLADIMSNFESVPAAQRRDRYDDILLTAITSQPAIVHIYSIWKPNLLDGMDRRYIGRQGSTATGQYAMSYGRNNDQIVVMPNLDIEYTMSYLNGPNARNEHFVNPTLFKVNGQDTYIARIEVPISNPRTNETVGTVGAIFDIR